MKFNEKRKSFLLLISYLILGLLSIGVVQLLIIPGWLSSSLVVLLFFVLINILTVRIFRLNNTIKTFWSLKKLYYLPIGIIAGGLIATIPVLVGVLLMGKATIDHLTFSSSFTHSSIIATFINVCWEELWFRGIFLNQCNKHLSAINLSIIMGALFMLVHLMNPEINLLKTGPNLFFAGALLTIVYFFFKTIWLPIGLHFGNNYFTIESNFNEHWLTGNEGYVGAIVLAILYLLFVKLTTKRAKQLV